MKRLQYLSLGISFFCWHFSIAQQADPIVLKLRQFSNDTLSANNPRLKEEPVKKFSATDVLDRTIKWANPYPEKLISDLNGFDLSKVGKLPPKGVYPRIFTSPDEFESIKKRLETTKIGIQLSGLAKVAIEKMRNGEGTFGKYYIQLKQNEIKPAKDSFLSKEMANLLAIQGLLGQLNGDKALMNETAIVSANYLKTALHQLVFTPSVLGREEMVKEELYSNGALAKLYDFNATSMSIADRKIIVDLFASQTFGKYSVGMELPHHWRRWNHIPASSEYGLSILAIENENGYDKRIYDCAAEVAEDYLTYTFSSEGMSTEGILYTFGPMVSQLQFMAAIAKRGGKNLFGNPHFRAITDWLIYSLASNPDCLWNSHGDTGSTVDVPWTMMMIMKYFFPDDGKIDYLFANSLYKPITKIPDVSAFVFCNDPSKTAAEYRGVPPVKMPLTFFSASRGSFIARNEWNTNGLMFMLDGRQDMLYPSHDHSDRGNFWLAANGRIWVMDGFRSTESKYHSVITIDGRGQGYFATPAEWDNFIDKPEASFGLINYKYSFDWSWLKTPVSDAMLGKPLAPQWKGGVYEISANNLKKYYPGKWPQRDPLKKVAAYFSGSIATNPLIWTEDTWPMRLENYPVEYAFRTAGLIKGKHNYVLIIDDLKKDNTERLYEWAMPVQLDVEVVSIKQLVEVKQQTKALAIGFNTFSNNRTQGEYDIILGDKRMKRNMAEVDNNTGGIYNVGRFTPQKGDPQLLVRVLERTPAAIPKLEPNPRLETFENIKTEDLHQFYLRSMDIAKRLVIPSRSTNPNFKVLLFPYLHGEELPKTLWNENRTKLTVKWSDQEDEFTFSKAGDGHTETMFLRNGKFIFKM